MGLLLAVSYPDSRSGDRRFTVAAVSGRGLQPPNLRIWRQREWLAADAARVGPGASSHPAAGTDVSGARHLTAARSRG
jgi:hypothetical protein